VDTYGLLSISKWYWYMDTVKQWYFIWKCANRAYYSSFYSFL